MGKPRKVPRKFSIPMTLGAKDIGAMRAARKTSPAIRDLLGQLVAD